jgi:hypothetical protein
MNPDGKNPEGPEDRQDVAIRNLVARRAKVILAEPCPDAEVIAAYADGTLEPSERARWDGHFAVCDKCQDTLAALALSMPVDDPKLLAAAPEPLALAAATPQPGCAVLEARKKSRDEKRNVWTWLAPVMTAAAIVVMWFAFRPHALPGPAETQQTAQVAPAENPPPAAPPVIAAPTAASPNTAGTEAKKEVLKYTSADRARSGETAAENGRKANEPKDKNGEHMVAGGALPPADVPLPAPPASATAQAKSAATVPTLTREISEFGAASAAKQDSAAAQKAAPPQQSSSAASAAIGALSAAKQQSGSGAAAGNDAQGLPPQVAPGKPPQDNAARLTMVFPENGNVIWRIGHGGRIERSTDSEQTWQKQDSGVTNDLLAGSAPTNDVCWIAGTRGTILRTADGGAHWTKLTSPKLLGNVIPDWNFITAADANNATVSTLDGRTFSTSDGGTSWKVIRQ